MNRISFDDLSVFADLCRADSIYIDSFKDNLKKSGLWEMMSLPQSPIRKNCSPPSAPLGSTITAIQTGLFDNWPEGKFVKGTPNRYGMSMEIWTAPAAKIEAVKVNRMNHAFKTNMSLMSRRSMLSQISLLTRPRKNALTALSAEHIDCLRHLADRLTKDELVGLVNTNIRSDESEYARGVYYHPFQFVLVGMEDGRIVNSKLVTSLQCQPIPLGNFVDHDWQGGPLGRKVIRQARLDLCEFNDQWAS